MRIAGAVLLVAAAAALLLAGMFFFAFFGYCEDTCNGPDRTFLGALGAGAPFGVVAVGMLSIAAALLMRRPRVLPAIGIGVVGAAFFVGATVAVVSVVVS
jgi:hypothetical protein